MMKKIGLALMTIFILCINGRGADQKGGTPIGFLGGCEMDLDGDKIPDPALLIRTSKGYELIVILGSGLNAKAYHVAYPKSKVHLACHWGKQIKETDAGHGKKRGALYQTNGAYLTLSQPEGAAAAYFWTGDKFKEVWVSD
jgi:hypothetical protein